MQDVNDLGRESNPNNPTPAPQQQQRAPRDGAGQPRPLPRPKIRLFIEGRYQKLTRDLPQTVFFCPECKGRKKKKGVACERCNGHGKLTKDSVQELIERVVLPRYKCWDSKFHGAGREDVDVRMLGNGRPFILELLNPKIPMSDLQETEQIINKEYAGRISVHDLRLVARQRVAELKEAKHPKEYQIRVRPSAEVAVETIQKLIGQKIQVKQRTPERVAHRRADLDRHRWVEVLSMQQLADTEFLLNVRCEHGTYVKEFVSGEGGRTEPSLSGLLQIPCACVELDVTAILDPEPV
ncbi:MAG: tRNA pseudouridine(54/55) synthase Pus10, partial [Planctomycetota bacterium]